MAAVLSNVPLAVSVRDLGKRYKLGTSHSSGALYDTLARRVGRRQHVPDTMVVWALKDVSFDVAQGSVLGVLGRNGSGKSTLMRILARITAPSTGEATMHGRVAPLLQVGAGFHPDLSGRDNIRLSGAILGMSAAEIASLEPAIIEFADIGPFLDTAVKYYSSGMHLRLAFSVSAHMDAEIMLIDEVLSVGDALFQRKCTERIRELVKRGRTILYVSHSMTSVAEVCDRIVVLDHGAIVFEGGTDDGIAAYEREVLGTA